MLHETLSDTRLLRSKAKDLSQPKSKEGDDDVAIANAIAPNLILLVLPIHCEKSSAHLGVSRLSAKHIVKTVNISYNSVLFTL